MGKNHDGANISLRLTEAAALWDIPENKIAATVHDNGSRLNLAISLPDAWPDQCCFAHKLQSAISAVLHCEGPGEDAWRRQPSHFF